MSLVRRWLLITVLGFSGGIIFLLPFLFEAFYTPLGSALELNHTELGGLVSIFGLVSMFFYFPGGWFADRVSPRKLITMSMIGTGLAGLYFSTFPSYQISLAIHAFWGVCITFLFWGAMIRLARNSAPAEEQGRAFGTLEFIRGIAEGLTTTGLLVVFAWMGSTEQALSTVIVELSSVTIALGVLAWFVIEDVRPQDRLARSPCGAENAGNLVDNYCRDDRLLCVLVFVLDQPLCDRRNSDDCRSRRSNQRWEDVAEARVGVHCWICGRPVRCREIMCCVVFDPDCELPGTCRPVG